MKEMKSALGRLTGGNETREKRVIVLTDAVRRRFTLA